MLHPFLRTAHLRRDKFLNIPYLFPVLTSRDFDNLKIDKFEEYKYNRYKRPLAKMIDEFNYSFITMILKKNQEDDN
jgi:hypothetical protein